MRKSIFIKRLFLSFGADTELWYTTRKNNSRLYSLFGIRFCPDYCPNVGMKAFVIDVTFPFLIFSIGWATKRKQSSAK
ncbi:hypothetical protein [Morganella morganii]|uniref:hypothetical protein n=1 Tax=Morganella morganii TaxID=582 RepID=UPI00324E0A94